MNLVRSSRAVVVCSLPLLGLLLCGCPNPNLYTTPRTLDPGTVQWQLAPEVIGVSYNTTTASTNASGAATTQNTTASAVLPMVPSFGARVGMVDGFDMGFRLQNLDSLAVDGKIRLLKGSFDIAVDPGVQGFYASANNVGFGIFYLHLPVLLGLNVSKNVSIVASPGIIYDIATASVNNGSGVSGAATATGLWGRLGLGVDIRTSKKLAIHPEITAMQQINGVDALVWVAGFGFNIGAQPDYSDLGGEPAAPTEETAPAAGGGASPAPSASPSSAPPPPAPAPSSSP
jgi:hypothetical protein